MKIEPSFTSHIRAILACPKMVNSAIDQLEFVNELVQRLLSPIVKYTSESGVLLRCLCRGMIKHFWEKVLVLDVFLDQDCQLRTRFLASFCMPINVGNNSTIN